MSSKFTSLLTQARNRPMEEDEHDRQQEQENKNTPEGESIGQGSSLSPFPALAAPGPKSTSKPPREEFPSTFEKVEPSGNGEQFTSAQSPTRGRPRTGKRSDPNYTQITAYITKQTHLDVKIALLQEGQGREISEVVEELLAKWLKRRS